MQYLNSTLDHRNHKQPKENYMTNLAKKISELKTDQYDKKIYSLDEIGEKTNRETAKSLALCEEFGINTTIILSEQIHAKEELTALKGKTMSFREQGSNDEKIAELAELVTNLEDVFREKTHQAQKMQSHQAKVDAHEKALATLTPLANELAALTKKIKDNFTNIRVVDGNRNIFPNTINPGTFELMDKLAHPGGLN